MENETFIIGIFVIMLLAIVIIFNIPRIIRKFFLTDYRDYISLENIPNEFNETYQKLYNKYNSSLEKMRKITKRSIILQDILIALYLTVSILGVAYYLSMTKQIQNKIVIYMGVTLLFILIVVLIGISLYQKAKNKKKYKSFYKSEIMGGFIRIINDKLTYQPMEVESIHSREKYVKAEFDKERFNRFYPDDYVEGLIEDKIFLKMWDLRILNVTHSGKHTNTKEVFKGIFGYTNCDKNIETYVTIAKNKVKLVHKEDTIEMDNQEFENYFDVYAGNKIVAMQLLTADIMEAIIKFYQKYRLRFEIVFRDNTIYLRFHTGPMFEPKIFGDSMDKELLFIYYSILKFILDLTKKTNKVLQDLEI